MSQCALSGKQVVSEWGSVIAMFYQTGKTVHMHTKVTEFILDRHTALGVHAMVPYH